MNKKLLTIPTSLLLTGAVWPVVTMAEDTEAAKGLDRNQDGYISVSEAEADAYLSDQFAHLDVNGDGLLDKDEMAVEVDHAEKSPE